MLVLKHSKAVFEYMLPHVVSLIPDQQALLSLLDSFSTDVAASEESFFCFRIDLVILLLTEYVDRPQESPLSRIYHYISVPGQTSQCHQYRFPGLVHGTLL